jgi:hypothetical protein
MSPQTRNVRAPAVLALISAFVAACAPAGLTPAPSVAVTATPAAAATAAPTPTSRATTAPAPSGVLLLPTGFAQALEPGTYWSAPPFDIGFSFEVVEEGWVAGHLNPEFVDIQRHAGTPVEGVMPERVVGFAHPLQIHGSAMTDAAGLSPAAAVQLWVDRTDIETANVEELELLGGDAVRVDLHAPVSMLPLFGGDDGIFRLDSALDVRAVVVAIEGGLFLATVHAPAAELEAAWLQALPILESIDLG